MFKHTPAAARKSCSCLYTRLPVRTAPGARFRESLDMGSFSGGSSTLNRAIDSLREDFGPDRYNVLTRNCNTFSSALCEELLGKPIPGYVNRLAWMGETWRGEDGRGRGGREGETGQKVGAAEVQLLSTSAAQQAVQQWGLFHCLSHPFPMLPNVFQVLGSLA